MFDLILQVLSGHIPSIWQAATLFWPLVSIPDLIKMSGLLVVAAIVQLWARKCRNNSRRGV